MSNPEAIVDAQLKAFNTKDINAFVDCFEPNVTVLSFPDGHVLADRSGPAFAERFRELFESKPGITAEITARIVKGQIVIDHELMRDSSHAEPRTTIAVYEVGATHIQKMWFLG